MAPYPVLVSLDTLKFRLSPLWISVHVSVNALVEINHSIPLSPSNSLNVRDRSVESHLGPCCKRSTPRFGSTVIRCQAGRLSEYLWRFEKFRVSQGGGEKKLHQQPQKKNFFFVAVGVFSPPPCITLTKKRGFAEPSCSLDPRPSSPPDLRPSVRSHVA